jgi:ABC-2 type transport system ATP-binding protein
MSVKVNELTKIYGTQKAVDQVSFEAKKGEVLGFLGPNGAGKTTTMKVITCFIPQTSGEVTVCGFDVEKESMEVRKRIGYLPEHNPLYKEMYVKEYLRFIGGMHKIKNLNSRIDEMIQMTGLEREQHKLIGTLSKGYRQRVGLAQAMIHDPEVLILDEPTSGLDPNQMAEVRQLIKDIGQEKTVVFSTHIMQEVQKLCDRVIIINKGKLVANDSIEVLQQKISGRQVTVALFETSLSAGQLKKIAHVEDVQPIGENRWQLFSTEDIRKEVFEFAVKQQVGLLELYPQVSTVEDVFQKLTRN